MRSTWSIFVANMEEIDDSGSSDALASGEMISELRRLNGEMLYALRCRPDIAGRVAMSQQSVSKQTKVYKI